MTSRDSPVTEDELHAFVDGQLPADRLAAVEAWLAAHPDDAAMVATWHVQADAIRARFGEVQREPVPERLKVGTLLRERRNWRAIAAVAAALAFLMGGVAGWMIRGTEEVVAAAADPADQIAQEALSAHKLYAGEMRHPVEVNAGEDHLLPWLSRRLDTPLRIPDFSAFDLKLLGARLLPGPSSPAAQFMFESSNGERITFYCSRLGQDQAALRYYVSDHVAAVRWVVGGYGYVVSGPADKARLKELAKSAFEQLENRAPPRSAPRSSSEPVISRRGG
jgi:anti-sigma factor RsiW